MAINDEELELAEERMRVLMASYSVITARYQRTIRRLSLELITGLKVSIPVDRLEGLAGAKSSELCDMELSPSRLGIHWPQLDADVYIPGVLHGTFGSKKWMACLHEAETAGATSAHRPRGKIPRTADGDSPRDVEASPADSSSPDRQSEYAIAARGSTRR